MTSSRMVARLPLVSEETLSEPERAFILKAALTKAIRLDGRKLDEPRICAIEVKTINKSRSLAQCSLGNGTKASCSLSAELTLPYPDRPNEGILNIQTDYMHSAGSKSNSSIDMQPFERSIQKAIDVESLCILPGLRVWTIRCQIIVTNDCGSVMDACSLATCAALLHFRRPEVTVVGEEVTVHAIDERIPVPLSIHYTPVSVTFALLDTSDVQIKNDNDDSSERQQFLALADPTDREELAAEGGMFQIMLNAHREICGLVESGPLLPRSAFAKLTEIANQVRQERGEILEDAVLGSPFL